METIPFTGNLVRRQWRKSRGYTRLSPTNNKRNVKITRFGSGSPKRSAWRLRLTPKLRLARAAASPLKLWRGLKNAYMKMMLRLADASGTSTNGCSVFGGKRIPRARQAPMAYSRSEFENRLILEICKSMAASLELGYNK